MLNAKTATGFILLQSIIYGYGDAISKYAFDQVSVYPLLFVRYWMAVVVLFLVFNKRAISGLKSSRLKPLILPSLCIAMSYIVTNVAISLTSPTIMAFLRSLTVVFTPILAWIAYRSVYSKKHIPIQLLILAGLYLLCGVREQGFQGFGIGEMLSLLGSIMAAGALVFGKSALESTDSVTLTIVQAIASALSVTIILPFVPDAVDYGNYNVEIWGVIAYMAITCTVGGYLLQNQALTAISARLTALLQCTYPVMTAIFAYFVLEEKLSFDAVIGSAIILGCVVAETLLQSKD